MKSQHSPTRVTADACLPRKPVLRVFALGVALGGMVLLAACTGLVGGADTGLACNDGIKAAFKPDAMTTVVAVRKISKGESLVAVDSASPITAAADMCMVKLLVGPGVTSEPKTAPSYSEGIGIEVWLPTHANWNERIRDYGGGGWVGGGHRHPGQIGSKVPAIVNANMGYAVGTTDSGQPLYQDGSFILKAAAPAISQEKFGLGRFYVQVVMKNDLGYDATDIAAAKAFAVKGVAVNARAVAACDKERLGFLLDPFRCDYDPMKDAGALCAGVAGKGVTGTNANATACVTLKEAEAIDKIWYGATTDGTYDPDQTLDSRSGKTLGAKQLWWNPTRGSDFSALITNPGTDQLVMLFQDAGYASSHPFSYTSAAARFVNSSTTVRDKWREVTWAGLADAFNRTVTMQAALGNLFTDRADLRKLRDSGHKVLIHHGLGEDVIPPAGMVNYYTRVAETMGGDAEVQKFLRLYLTPGVAHSSQGRSYTITGNNNTVPLPKLPGNANQTPSREQDQMFTALVDWVEKGIAPGNIVITSRDNTTSYPVCVYPQKIKWSGTDSARLASSYVCQ